MAVSEQIKILCIKLNISVSELARLYGSSPQAFSQKMKREKFTPAELKEIAKAAGCEYESSFILPTGDRVLACLYLAQIKSIPWNANTKMSIIYKNNQQIVIEIKKLMLEKQVSQREIAERLNIKPQGLTKLLNKKNFGFEDAEKVLSALGYDLVLDFSEKKEV